MPLTTSEEKIEFMRRLSLVDYLANHIGEGKKQLLYESVFAFDSEGKADADHRLRDANLWPTIDKILRDISVLDPACGSGSFLVGMLRILDDLADRANKELGHHELPYDRRKRIIGRSLYGVDVMSWAVDIAELRLWLHLIIHSEIVKEQLTIELPFA